MGTTTKYALPYPELSEPADVPLDMRELAERVETVTTTVDNAIGARVFHSADQSTPTGAFTALTFNSERFDTDNCHDGTNPTRLTCRTAGKYVIFGSVQFALNTGGNQRRLAIRLIGGSNIVDTTIAVGAASLDTPIAVSTMWDLAVGNYVELMAFHDRGSALNVIAAPFNSPEFGFVRIGA